MPILRKKSFTLIELLAVVAIASVLIAIMAPTFNRMLFGNKVDQFASNLKLGMELAQAKAVTSRKFVAMVLPGNYNAVSDTRLKQYVNGGYRLAYVQRNGNAWEFISWVPDESWRNPADGAMLVYISDLAGSPSRTNDALNKNSYPSEANVSFRHLASFTGIDNDLTAIFGASSYPRTALIFSPYGGSAGDSTTLLYFVVTEAAVAGGSYRYSNTDDIRVLKLNPITGRVTYYEAP